jgi:hypothetical protein
MRVFFAKKAAGLEASPPGALDFDAHNIEVVCHEPIPAAPGRPAAR